jgi:hypothetical protein
MEAAGSLPHSQVSANCPYPEPARSSPKPTSYLLKIHLNIIIPSTPGSPKWSLSLGFPPHQNPVYASPLPHLRYISRPSHFSRFYHSNNICWGVQIIKLLIMWFLPLPCNLIRLRPKYSQLPILKHPQPTFLLQCERSRFTPIKKNRQNHSFVYLNP